MAKIVTESTEKVNTAAHRIDGIARTTLLATLCRARIRRELDALREGVVAAKAVRGG